MATAKKGQSFFKSGTRWVDYGVNHNKNFRIKAYTSNITPATYKVTFNANGGSVGTASKTVVSGDVYGTLPTPTKSNSQFLGWFTDPNSGTQIKSGTTVTIKANQTLYAHWKTSGTQVGSYGGKTFIKGSDGKTRCYNEKNQLVTNQFAFDGSENSSYLPYKYEHNCVVYTGTHDNETTKGWLENLQGHDRDFVREYINCYEAPVNDCVWALIRTALSSVADLAVIPIQDYLCLGNEARMNAPSTLGDNWKWRLTANQISETTLYHMREVTRIYGRLAKVSEEKETDEIANAEEEERQDNDQNSKIVE